MFKYVAITLVAFVAGIAATFAAVGYADDHPDSFLAHYVNKVRASMVSETTGSCAETACMAPADPSPCPLALVDSMPPVIRVEATPMAAPSNRLPGAIVINEQERIQQTGATSATEPEPCEVPDQVRKIMLSLRREELLNLGVEESEPAAPFMPYCQDDEPAPAVMPYAEENNTDKAGGLFLTWWSGLFHLPDSNAAAGSEQSSAPLPSNTPECKEDPTTHLQYPGLPFSGFIQSKKPSPNGKTKSPVAPFEEELQEAFPAPKTTPDFKNLLKKDGTLGDPKLHSHIDTTECRPSDFGFDHLGLRPF